MSRPESSASLYDCVGTHYDVTRRADPYLVERLIQHLDAERPGTYVDVACGTGNYTLAVAQTSLRMHGIDQSPRMIAAARKKGLAVSWHHRQCRGLAIA
jgi:ubiquinone/menaquinone biosynthesis C-methylase UbiE